MASKKNKTDLEDRPNSSLAAAFSLGNLSYSFEVGLDKGSVSILVCNEAGF